jgi:sugar phosphate permease
MHAIVKNKLLLVTYALTILFALHYAIPLYVTSSYLHQYFNSSLVSAIYVLSSLVALFTSMMIADSIRKFHTYSFTFCLVIAEIIATIAFVYSESIYIIALLYIIHYVLQVLLYVCLNIFIESFSKHTNTGSIRGLFLMVYNLGFLVSPVISCFLLKFYSFKVLYVFASLMLVPFLYFLHKYLAHIKEPAYHRVFIMTAIRRVLENKNLKAVFIAELTVQCFYATMVIYSPLYLTTIGVTLTTYLGVILPLALIPLVILPFEFGILAEKKFSEKDMLIAGMLILIVTTFTCVLVTVPDTRIWVTVLLISRIGASCVETMAFTYYFKKVGPENPSMTALFSNTYGLATIIIGSIGFLVGPFLVARPQLMFIILGCGMLWCLAHILPMKGPNHHTNV